MANRFLRQIYKKLYNESFVCDDFSQRLQMQKGIYLLQEMGVPVGDYRFSWYKHGPYSQSLLNDMYSARESSPQVVLAPETEIAISMLNEALIVPEQSPYSQDLWAECLGSLHYLKENICSFGCSSEDLLKELMKRKPHLDDRQSNQAALSKLGKLFS